MKSNFALQRWLAESTEKAGNAKALVYRDTYLSWRGLAHRVDRRAQEFRAMGLGDGCWVGLMLGNVPDFVILALALSKVGAVVVPIDPTTATRELDLILDAAPLRALITRPRGGPESSATPDGRGIVPSGPTPRRDVPESRRRLQGTLLTCTIFKRPIPKLSQQPEAILFTSDSGGDPKAIVRTTANIEAEAERVGATLELSSESKILAAVPLFHAYGFDLGLVAALKYGAVLFLEDEIAPKRIAKVLREHGADVVPGTPQVYAELTKIPTARPIKTKGLRYLVAGSKLTEALAEDFYEKYGVRLLPAYHTSETGLVAFEKKSQSVDSVGKGVEGVEIRVVPASEPTSKVTVVKATKSAAPAKGAKSAPTKAAKSAPVAKSDESGAIWVKSSSVAAQVLYPVPPAKVAKGAPVPVGGRDAEGFVRTGDLGKLDKAGRLTLTGREDDLVKVDGKRVALGEVAGCLESFPKVREARALLIDDPLAGPMVVAQVVARGSVAAEEIIDHCAKNLAPYKVPRRIEFLESLK